MSDLFGGDKPYQKPQRRKLKPKPSPNPAGLELTLLDTCAAWGPFTYPELVNHLYFIEKYKRATENLIREAIVGCIQAGWMKPLGTSLSRGQGGYVLWGLTNTRRYKVYVPQEKGQHEACRVWEIETGFSCTCCKAGLLPEDGLDPGMPWCKDPLW